MSEVGGYRFLSVILSAGLTALRSQGSAGVKERDRDLRAEEEEDFH